MKLWIAIPFLAVPMAAVAQDGDVEELKREMNRRLAQLEEQYQRERARVQAEFEKAFRGPEQKPSGVEGLMDRLEKRLADLDRRLGEMEKRLGREPENVQKFFREQFDWNQNDMRRWMEQGRKFFQEHRGGAPDRVFKIFENPEEALRHASRMLEEALRHFDGEEPRGRIREAIEQLRRILEKRD
jgi:hypothetical protein